MKMKAALPSGDLNGLSAVHSQLIKNRGKKILVVGAVTSHEFTDVEGKGREAKVELVRIEAVPPELQAYIAELIERALEDRTGQTALDLDIEGTTDLRKEFKPKKPAADAQPDLFAAPPAITAGSTPPEEVVDAEVVDEADENAAEREDADAERSSEEWTVEQRTRILEELGLDDEAPARDVALAIQEAADDANQTADEWVAWVLAAPAAVEPEGVPMDQFFRQQAAKESGGFVADPDDEDDETNRPGLD